MAFTNPPTTTTSTTIPTPLSSLSATIRSIVLSLRHQHCTVENCTECTGPDADAETDRPDIAMEIDLERELQQELSLESQTFTSFPPFDVDMHDDGLGFEIFFGEESESDDIAGYWEFVTPPVAYKDGDNEGGNNNNHNASDDDDDNELPRYIRGAAVGDSDLSVSDASDLADGGLREFNENDAFYVTPHGRYRFAVRRLSPIAEGREEREQREER